MRVNFTTSVPDSYTLDYDYGGTDVSYIATGAYFTSETVSGVRRKLPKSWREPTNYSLVRTHYMLARGSVGYVNSVKKYRYKGTVGGSRWNSLNMFNGAYTWSSFPSSVANTALIKARNALQGGKVNYGQAIGEANQTARLVGDSCLRLLGAVRSLRRGDARGVAKYLTKHKKPPRRFVKKVQRTISAAGIKRQRRLETEAEALRLDKSIRRMKNVTGAWLELQYGWKPLLQDVQGSIENLNQFTRYDWIYTAKGSDKQVIKVDRGIQGSYYSAFASGYCDVSGINACKYIIIGIPDQTPASFLADAGLLNLPLVGWELVPFSFVVDWVLPIGDYLDSLDATLGFSQLRTVKIEFTKIRWDEHGDMSCPHKGTVFESEFHGYKDFVRHVRTVTSGVPQAMPPSFKNPLSFGHMANGLALLVQIFGGKSSVR